MSTFLSFGFWLFLSLPTQSANSQTGQPSPDYGPFFTDEPVSDTSFSNGHRPEKPPLFSLAQGTFCFLEDARCRIALLLSADIAVGMNITTGPGGLDLPYTQFGARGGLTFRPFTLSKNLWHPWSIGVIGSWSRGSGTVAPNASAFYLRKTAHNDVWRLGLINQIWLSRKTNAFHLDLTLGLVRSKIANQQDPAFGGHLEFSLGWSGWAAIFVGGDFFPHDARIVSGFRAHGIAAGPAIALVLLGLLAGGALQ